MVELGKVGSKLRHKPVSQPEKIDAVMTRVGRWLGRYAAAARQVEVSLKRDEAGRAVDLNVKVREERDQWSELVHGAYLLRTNCTERDPAQLWKWYVQLTQAEAAFRTAKSDLGLRPVYHQLACRVEAHILVCFLALVPPCGMADAGAVDERQGAGDECEAAGGRGGDDPEHGRGGAGAAWGGAHRDAGAHGGQTRLQSGRVAATSGAEAAAAQPGHRRVRGTGLSKM